MKTSSDTEQLATVEEVKNMVRSSSGGLGGRLIGTYKFRSVNGPDQTTIKLTTPADYLIVNVITGLATHNVTTNYNKSSCSIYAQSTTINSVIVCKGGNAYIPSSYGYDVDSDAEYQYCVDAFSSFEMSLSSDGSTITNKVVNSDASSIGNIEAYSFT